MEESTVEYRDVPGFPGYRVGDDGSVWSCWERHYPAGGRRVGVQYRVGTEWKPLKLTRFPRYSYLDVQLRRDGKAHHRLVHRLVAIAFLGPPPADGMEAAHENGVSDDNRLSNLSWKTKKANQADRVRHGTHNRGERHGIARLTDRQAAEIIPRVDAGESRVAIAREYGVSRYVVGHIARGRSYRHLRGIAS